jgi:hypothetical protein
MLSRMPKATSPAQNHRESMPLADGVMLSRREPA